MSEPRKVLTPLEQGQAAMTVVDYGQEVGGMTTPEMHASSMRAPNNKSSVVAAVGIVVLILVLCLYSL